MRKIISFNFLVLSLFFASSAFSQIVVPKGWENRDSLRFTFFGMYGGVPSWTGTDTAVMHREMDSLNVNFEAEFSSIPGDYNFGQRNLGSVIYGFNNFFPLPVDMMGFKQLPYLALPFQVPDHFYDGLMWRYNEEGGMLGTDYLYIAFKSLYFSHCLASGIRRTYGDTSKAFAIAQRVSRAIFLSPRSIKPI